MKQKEPIKLEPQYITGIPGIDDQHTRLIAMCNSVLDNLEKKDVSFESVSASVQEIVDELKSHFSTEESLMEMIGFPEIAGHKTQHEKLGKLFSEELKNLNKDVNAETSRSVCTMRDSELEHMAVYDIEYAIHIEKIISLRQKFNITALKARTLTK